MIDQFGGDFPVHLVDEMVAPGDDGELIRFVERAASALSVLQAHTRHPDGSVLVHGDYWLGNVLIDRDRLVGVIDWEEAHRGSDVVDRVFLVESLLSSTGRAADSDFVSRLHRAVERGMSIGHVDGQSPSDEQGQRASDEERHR